MAKLSAINNNEKKARMIKAKAATRAALKATISNKETSFEDRLAAVMKLSEMPRNSSRIRYRNRCRVTGRPHGVYRKFQMSRVSLREYASAGLLPGVTKASW